VEGARLVQRTESRVYSLFVDDQQRERDRYRDDLDGPFGEQSGSTTVVTGSSGSPVEEIVVTKKSGRSKSASNPAVSGHDGAYWPTCRWPTE
jgi:hypothetical protein